MPTRDEHVDVLFTAMEAVLPDPPAISPGPTVLVTGFVHCFVPGTGQSWGEWVPHPVYVVGLPVRLIDTGSWWEGSWLTGWREAQFHATTTSAEEPQLPAYAQRNHLGCRVVELFASGVASLVMADHYYPSPAAYEARAVGSDASSSSRSSATDKARSGKR